MELCEVRSEFCLSCMSEKQFSRLRGHSESLKKAFCKWAAQSFAKQMQCKYGLAKKLFRDFGDFSGVSLENFQTVFEVKNYFWNTNFFQGVFSKFFSQYFSISWWKILPNTSTIDFRKKFFSLLTSCKTLGKHTYWIHH